jgi:hypothetical protein
LERLDVVVVSALVVSPARFFGFELDKHNPEFRSS